MITEETYKFLCARQKDYIDSLLIEEVRIGIYLTAVRLSDGSMGIAATLPDCNPFPGKTERDFSDFSPLMIRGRSVTQLLGQQKDSGIILTLKTAALNAISSKIINSGGYNIIENCDPLDFVSLNEGKVITIVGAFQSYIRKIAGGSDRLHVLELNENALSAEYRKFYVPAGDYAKVLPGSDLVIITGNAIVNNTIDGLLAAIPAGAFVIVTGPSASIVPDVLFSRNVAVVGAVRITKPELVFSIVAEGGTGYHLHRYCAQKICILP